MKREVKDFTKKYNESQKKFRESQYEDSDYEDNFYDDKFKNLILKNPKKNINFQKLVDECSQLNQNLMKTSQILTSLDQTQFQKRKIPENKGDDKFSNFQNFTPFSEMTFSQKKSLTQLQDQLQREQLFKQSDQTFGGTRQPRQINLQDQQGRDFLRSRQFDVEEFEAQLYQNRDFQKRNLLSFENKPLQKIQDAKPSIQERKIGAFSEFSQQKDYFKQRLVNECSNNYSKNVNQNEGSQSFKNILKKFEIMKAKQDKKLSFSQINLDQKEQEEVKNVGGLKEDEIIFGQRNQECLNENQELQNIQSDKPAIQKVSFGYLQALQNKVKSKYLKNLNQKNIQFSGKVAQEKTILYQSPLHQQVYSLRTFESEYKHQIVENDASNFGLDYNLHIFDMDYEIRRLQSVQDFAHNVISQLDYQLRTYEYIHVNNPQQFEEEILKFNLVREKEIFMSIWIAIKKFSLQKIAQTQEIKAKLEVNYKFGEKAIQHQTQKEIIEDYIKDKQNEDLNLYFHTFFDTNEQNDIFLSRTLAEALSERFIKDLGIDSSRLNEQQIINILINWINQTAKPNNQNLIYNEYLQTYIYGIIFMLFICGMHDLALKVLNQFAQDESAFIELYDQYVNTYKAKGVPKNKVKLYYQQIIANNRGQSDQYRNLLVNLMIGSLYIDSSDFRQEFLFDHNEIQLWVYLKLASFQFHDETSQQQRLAFDMPSFYKGFSLKDLRDKLSYFDQVLKSQKQQYNDQKQNDPFMLQQLQREELELTQALFFSGQFSNFSSRLLGQDQDFFIDACHISIQLQQLNLMPTKFGLTKMLFQQNKILNEKQINFNILLKLYQGESIDPNQQDEMNGCLDLVALLTYYLSQIKIQSVQSNEQNQPIVINSVTDALSLSCLIQDEEISLASLALYIVNNKEPAIETVLEIQGKEFLSFQNSKIINQQFDQINQYGNQQVKNYEDVQMTLKQFMSETENKKLIIYIVEFNQQSFSVGEINVNNLDQFQFDNFDVNMLLLDKIFDHQKVFEILIQLQYGLIVKNQPNDFLKPSLDTAELNSFVKSKELREQIKLVRVIKKNFYEPKKSEFKKFESMYFEMSSITQISLAFNSIIQGKAGDAINLFEKINSLPLDVKNNNSVKYSLRKFQNLKNRFQLLILDCIVAVSKCIYMEAIQIINDNRESGSLIFDYDQKFEEQRQKLVKRQTQAKFLYDFISEIELCKVGDEIMNSQMNINEPQLRQQLIQKASQIGSLLRRIINDIV